MIRSPHQEILDELKGATLENGLRWRPARRRRAPAFLPYLAYGAAFALLIFYAATRG